jgi:2,5-diketo-D-gluconate reductase A
MALCCALALAPVAQIQVPLKRISSNVSIPTINIGTWLDGEPEDPKAIVSNWVAQGGRGIDTALVYNDQKQVAAALAESKLKREEYWITTKIPGCNGESTATSAVNQDLKALGAAYVDLMLIHSPLGLDCAGTWRALETFHDSGATRASLTSRCATSRSCSRPCACRSPSTVNQIEYSVLSHDDETIAFCRQHNITVEAYSPLGGAHDTGSVFKNPTVLEVASAHKVSPAQVAIRWIVQRGDILAVLSGNATHQVNDADVFNFELSDDEMTKLTSIQTA